MEKKNIQEERDREREASLRRHERLHRLFVEDRLSFERERKRLINEFFDSIEDQEKRDRMKALQDSWDKRMRNAGSAHNRLVLAKAFFWSHFHEVWHPAIQDLNAALNDDTADRQ